MTAGSLRALLLLLVIPLCPLQSQGTVIIGSKMFTESRVLAEMAAQLIEEHTTLKVERRLGLGGTLVCYRALQSGDIHLYPDYTGTGWSVIAGRTDAVTDPLQVYLQVRSHCERTDDLTWLSPLGFSNTYAMALLPERAEALQVRRISDLARHGSLRAGFSQEFLERPDGWPGLAKAYGLRFGARGLEHALAYTALLSGDLDLIDAYTTDGKLARLNLTLLEDDQKFFPPYHAAFVVRREILRLHPELRPVLERLAFQIDERAMQQANLAVEEGGLTFAAAARRFLHDAGHLGQAEDAAMGTRRRSFWGAVFSLHTLFLLLQHLQMTVIAVALAALVAIPLGILMAHRTRLQRVALTFANVVQTVPSLALLALLIPLPGFGLSATTAITALFLYSLLPILRNTATGLRGISPDLVESARSLGMTRLQLLRLILLPLAAPTILAGIRTAAVISVGVATLAAFIGAGGLGEPIATGLQLNDMTLILSGAIPAALLALATDATLGFLERRMVG